MNDYKNTGIEWLPLLPSTWEVRKVKQCFYISKSKAKQENPTILKLARESIQVRDVTNNEGQIAESYFDYNPVNTGDLLINPMDLYSGANCNVSELEGVISPAYINLRKKVLLSPKYFDYYFKYQYWTMAMFAHGKGVSFDNRWTINSESMLNYELPFPPYYIQDLIVRKLNEELVKVDQLIQNQKQQIEKLKEYKQSLISEVVTKGLDPNVKFKDSGNEWLEKIPSTWNVTKLLNILEQKVTDGPHESLTLHDEGIPFISAEAIKNDKIDFNLRRGNISKDDYEICCKKYIPKINDIYMVKSGATTGNLAIVETDEIFTIWSPLAAIRAKSSYNYKYLFYFLKSDNFQKQVQLNWSYGTQQNLSMRVLEKLSIAIPPYKEQVDMVELLDNKTSKIDKLIDIKNKKLRELNDYKKSLIYEYVTGKKEVS